jgi:hypothetical protein
MLRITGRIDEVDGKYIRDLSKAEEAASLLALSNMDSNENMKFVSSILTPSSKDKQDGWIYLLADPGNYYLAFGCPREKLLKPEYWFQIRSTDKVVYIGSIYSRCNIIGHYELWCPTNDIKNEEDLAQNIASEHFKTLGQLTVSPLRPYPMSFNREQSLDFFPMGIITTYSESISPPNLRQEAINRVFAPKGEHHKVEEALREFPPFVLPIIVAVGAVYAVYIPFGVAYAATSGSAAEKEFLPILQELSQAIKTLNIQERLGEELQHSLPDALILGDNWILSSATEKAKYRSVLEMQITKLKFADCSEGKEFRLDAYFATRLWNSDISKLIYIHDSWEASSCHRLEVYKGEERDAIFRQDIMNLIQSAAESLKKNLGLESNK